MCCTISTLWPASGCCSLYFSTTCWIIGKRSGMRAKRWNEARSSLLAKTSRSIRETSASRPSIWLVSCVRSVSSLGWLANRLLAVSYSASRSPARAWMSAVAIWPARASGMAAMAGLATMRVTVA